MTFLRTWHCFSANTSGVASTPRNRSFFRMVLVAMVAFCTACSAAAQPSLDALLEPFLARYQIPALAAAVVQERLAHGRPAQRFP